MNPQPPGCAAPNKASMPSLYADAVLPASDAEIQTDSILGELEQSRPHRNKLAGILVIATVAALGIGWWQGDGFARHADTRGMALAAADHGSDVSPKITQPAGAAAHQDENARAAAVDVALAESGKEIASLPAHVITENQDTDASAPQVVGEPALAYGNPENSATQANVTTASAGRVPSAATELASVERPQAKTGTPISPEPVSSPGHGKRAEVAKTPKNKQEQKDGDVELIAALLNRVSSRREPAAEEIPRKAASAAVPQSSASLEQKKNRKAGSARENYASKTAESAEMQLRRCTSLGFFEGELCRFRACDGRWGSTPGCPEYSQASAALP